MLAGVIDYAAAAGLERLVVSPSQASMPFWRRSGFVDADDLLVYRFARGP